MVKKQSTKLLGFYILEILRKYTDENHKLIHKEILTLLNKEFDISVNRKTLTRTLKELIYFFENSDLQIGYKIDRRNVPVKDGDKQLYEEQEVYTDFYLKRSITDAELRMIVDALMFSMNISYKHRKDLINKLCGLSSKYFKSKVNHITSFSDKKNYNQSVLLNVELLDEAIDNNKKVSFKYLEYRIDKKLHVKNDKDGKERVYTISPYQMAVKDGKYYLICNYDKYDDISNYRIDRIKDIEILDENRKSFESLCWTEGKKLDLDTYMKQHIYMYSSPNRRVKFKITKPMISDIIDMFGTDLRFMDEKEDCVTVSAIVNEQSIVQFAKSYGPDVEILEPLDIRQKVKDELEKAFEVYRR